MRRILFVMVCVSLAAFPALAQTKPEPIKREQSKLWLEDVLGMANPQVIYVYSGWTPNYSAERFYAQAIARGAALPRLQVNLAMLTPGWVWMADSAMGEKYVKQWPFFQDRDVKMQRQHGGGSSGVIIVPFSSGDANCFAFLIRNVSIGTIEGQGSGGRPSVDGFYCGPPGATLDDAQMRTILASIRVTEDLSRVRSALVAAVPGTPPPASPPYIAAPTPPPAAAAPPPAAAASAPRPPASTAALPPAPGVVGWSAAPGTRFVTRNGYFEIVRFDDGITVTLNAGNQSARWAPGLLTMRSRGAIDPATIAKLHPLAVGKEITFEEKGNGDDAWRHTVRVTGTETIVVKERSYQTFVIAARDQSLNPDQGGFDRTRTIWVAPEAGGILRYRTKQDGGPSIQGFNFDVVEILPPGSGS